MCGRYVNVASTSDLAEEFEIEEALDEAPAPSWNVAPTDPVRIVAQRRPRGAAEDAPSVRELHTVRWGLVPTWSKSADGGARLINARSETITTKPAFKRAAARRRCLIPALGYYEWPVGADGKKIPQFLHDPQDRLLAMAGLYELWRDPSRADDDPRRWLWTCTVITQPATDSLGHIHDRCPVIVPRDQRAAWLDCSAGDADEAGRLIATLPEPRLEPRTVSDAVGNVRHNGPELIEPVAGSPAPQELF